MNFISVRQKFLRVLSKSFVKFRTISDVQQKIKDSYYFAPGDVLLQSCTIGQLLDDAADKSGDRIVFISAHQGISKTFYEFRQEAEKLASGLIACGLRKGDRIGIFSPNCYEWPLVQFAAAKAGLILVTINFAYQAAELEYVLNKVQCKALVSWDHVKSNDLYDIMCQIMCELPSSYPGKVKSKKLPNLETVIMISDKSKGGTFKFSDISMMANRDSDEVLASVQKSVQFDDPCSIQFTSGTTGFPKGAVLSHHNVISNIVVSGRRLAFNLYKNTICVQVPLFHCYGCVLGVLGTVFFHQTAVFPYAGFNASASLQAIQKYRCTTVYGTPTMYVDLLHQLSKSQSNVSTLRQAVFGGASASETLIRATKKELGLQNIHIAYGSTENSPAVSVSGINDDFEDVANGIVPPLEYVELKVVDGSNCLVPVHTVGELCVRGHGVFLGYWEDEKKTKEVVDSAGWYHTGDLVTMNEYGRVQIAGRIKEMVIRGGENIFTREIENFLYTLPSILEVAVVGVPDERMGEELCAWIKLKDDSHLTEDEIRSFCKGKISHFKIPRYIMFVQDFPKTDSGKIKKFEITRISIEKLNLQP